MKFINLLIFNSDKTKILAVKRATTDLAFGGMWALPGGKIEKESIKQAARRELYEETGLHIQKLSNKNMFSTNPTLKGVKINIIIRKAEIKNYSPKPHDKDIEKVSWITPKKLAQSFEKFNIPHQEIQKFKNLFSQHTSSDKFIPVRGSTSPLLRHHLPPHIPRKLQRIRRINHQIRPVNKLLRWLSIVS